MPQQEFDKSGKWLLQNRGKAILFLGGARQVRSCRALQAEVVQPRRLPDGLLEVHYQGREGPHYVLVEVATYPEKRVPKQVADNMMLVLQTRGVLPDVLTLVLCPRGRYRVPEEQTVQSTLGWAEASFKWKVVELWALSAEELLAAEDVGLVPWVPLAHFEGPPEALLRRCRERIDREAGAQRSNLLAVSQVLARLKFPQPALLALLGGGQAMIESPLMKEFAEEIRRQTRQEGVLENLKVRFGKVPDAIEAEVRRRFNEEQLRQLHNFAAVCPSVDAFRERLESKPPQPADAPPRKRRSRKK